MTEYDDAYPGDQEPAGDAKIGYAITGLNLLALAAIPLPIWQATMAAWANAPRLPLRDFYV
tara:strand:- start:3875 stop:4057 length:183 start_codon:yes stop_codon:yes gene_type:complete